MLVGRLLGSTPVVAVAAIALLGVGLAYLFGLALPALRARSRNGSKS